jgi:hypothetical protein
MNNGNKNLEARMIKTLTGAIAALFLATGTAQATEMYEARCGNRTISIFARNGWSFTEGEKELPTRLFRVRQDRDGQRVIYFRGQKCRLTSTL